MSIDAWLKTAEAKLTQAGISTARLDALVLLQDLLNKNGAQVLANPDHVLTAEQVKTLDEQTNRRAQHIPLAYIRGKTEFYGREFIVTADVLEPRPETETMIDLLKQLPREAQKNLVDVGTGSGAIAITAACELHETSVIATDVDPACLKVARQNCVKHQATVDLKQTDLIEGLRLAPIATVLANLPYVPDNFTINEAALHEPKLAIFGGPDGLDLYKRLFEQLVQAGHQGYVLTESLPPQHHHLAQLARSHGYVLETKDDFIQVFTRDQN